MTSSIQSDTIGKISYEIDWVRDYLRTFEPDVYRSTTEQLLVFMLRNMGLAEVYKQKQVDQSDHNFLYGLRATSLIVL